MRKIVVIAAFAATILSTEYVNGQTKAKSQRKPRISRTTNDTSLTRFRQRALLMITDTTGIGLGTRTDTLGKLSVKPNSPSLPPQNNPNPHSPNPTVVNPERPAVPATRPPEKEKKKK